MKLSPCVLLTISLIYHAKANMAPSYPEPGTVWRSGEQYKIVWYDDKNLPSTSSEWRKFKIDFMTGENNRQKFLKNVAFGLDATKSNSLSWIAPEVEPHAPIYFFMFTNEKGDRTWTTRFSIVGSDGKLDAAEHDTQPDGTKVPWGVGKIVPKGNTTLHTPLPVYSLTPAQSSVAAENAALVIAVSDASTSYATSNRHCLFMLLGFMFFSIALFTY
ncbi:hypothetical protein G6F37_000953 [Rhizopus arrhizus]|nr:hypothetical protein G6F38_003245 [Rhizopus arrhizus]KAG1163728.1 hypothetical protein G6F37_000953 [Rhizopus arrhizus]